LKLLEAIGAVEKPDPTKRDTSDMYQESVTALVDREFDDEGLGDNDEEDDDSESAIDERDLQAVPKVCLFFFVLRS
jgi:hypothetical protein